MSIENTILDSIALKKKLLDDKSFVSKMNEIIKVCVNSLQNGGKLLFCGNGGSASDAQHLAAELTGKYYFDRPPLNAEALHVNGSYMTAVANDYSFEDVFSRMIHAKARKGDVLIGLSTSGNSKNIIKAFEAAKEIGVVTIGFTGNSGGGLKNLSIYLLNVPSDDTARIQEIHILLGHIICEQIEAIIFKK